MRYDSHPRLKPSTAITDQLDAAADYLSANPLGQKWEFAFSMGYDNRGGTERAGFRLDTVNNGVKNTPILRIYTCPANPPRNRVADWSELPDIPDTDCMKFDQESLDKTALQFLIYVLTMGIVHAGVTQEHYKALQAGKPVEELRHQDYMKNVGEDD